MWAMQPPELRASHKAPATYHRRTTCKCRSPSERHDLLRRGCDTVLLAASGERFSFLHEALRHRTNEKMTIFAGCTEVCMMDAVPVGNSRAPHLKLETVCTHCCRAGDDFLRKWQQPTIRCQLLLNADIQHCYTWPIASRKQKKRFYTLNWPWVICRAPSHRCILCIIILNPTKEVPIETYLKQGMRSCPVTPSPVLPKQYHNFRNTKCVYQRKRIK